MSYLFWESQTQLSSTNLRLSLCSILQPPAPVTYDSEDPASGRLLCTFKYIRTCTYIVTNARAPPNMFTNLDYKDGVRRCPGFPNRNYWQRWVTVYFLKGIVEFLNEIAVRHTHVAQLVGITTWLTRAWEAIYSCTFRFSVSRGRILPKWMSPISWPAVGGSYASRLEKPHGHFAYSKANS